jgi:hypothetical protein
MVSLQKISPAFGFMEVIKKPMKLYICLSVYGSTILSLDIGSGFRFLILYTVGRTPWTGDQPVARPLPT